MKQGETWYVIKQSTGHCTIVSSDQLLEIDKTETKSQPEKWGPFSSQAVAIAHRVGLIRAGKCQPV